MVGSGGGAGWPLDSCRSASWVIVSPSFAVMFSRKYVYVCVLLTLYSFSWNRFGKSCAVWVSRTVQFVPSFDACSVQSRGSRPAESFADVIAYFVTRTGSDIAYWSQTGAV